MSGEALLGRREGEGGREPSAGACIVGHVYRIVQTTGLDGKNLLKLLPVSKSPENLSLAPSSAMPDNAKGNISDSGHISLKGLLANNTTSLSVKTPEFKMSSPGKLILPQPLGQVGNMTVTTNIKENPSIPTISSIQSNYLSDDRSSLQKDTLSVSSDKSKASYVLLNSENLPMMVKSPVVPSGHHLQIPAHAEVKSVLASSLPPAIQQKILAAASNASGTSEAAKQPTVIYMSPVNTVKTSVSIPLQNVYPKPISQVSKSLVFTTAQTAGNHSALSMVKSDGQKTQGAPMKWVVQENPQSPASCLVPVQSSNNMASEILKSLANMKNVKSNPSSILPACANSLSGSQAKITSIKENALVMYDGKIYLLTKKEAKIVSAQDDNQISSSAEIQSRKHTSQLIHSAADSTVTNQVVNLVLSKNKGIVFNAKDLKSSENNTPHQQYELNKNLKAIPVLSTSPHGNLQVTSTSQHEAISTSDPVPTGMDVAPKTVAKENAVHHVLEKCSLKPSSAVLQQFAFTGEEQKFEKIKSSGMAIQIKHRKERQRKQYIELRKKFGLFKEERVYLRRIPLSVSLTRPEAAVCSNNVQMNDPCELLQTVPIIPDHKEKEKIIEKQGEEVNIKRKVEMAPLLEKTKRRKSEVKSALDPNLKCSDSYLEMDNPYSPCSQVISQQENPTSSSQCSPGGDSDPSPSVQSNEQDSLSPALHYCENETSFNEGSFRDDIFLFSPPDLEETKRDEEITRLKLLLKEQEAALEEIRKKMKQS
ncbi:ligand-dependent nuclear receptor-interacting factor 1 isoform X2 [Tiliqua scincoides]|uniref:ligand-dependent nuclear receptor-interacting factor 1 isoform X2 n=1 Tax=Tiliqua scincoides TaxID=71010 RepID=UPI003462379F